MKKIIQKPVNWQDFESLCKMLWGEIWKIPDSIKKNGRLGQSQSGVDIYGIPKGKSSYSGIQCKGKDDNLNSKINEKEIISEITKALLFSPKLGTFIIATTANKDASLEEFVRIKNIESLREGRFEILLYCWEDIADLIESNRDTFNYYVLENQFKMNFEVKISFSDGSFVTEVNPTFIKTVTKTILENQQSHLPHYQQEINIFNFSKSPFADLKANTGIPATANASWCSFKIGVENIGSEVLEDYKLYITPEKGKFRNLRANTGGLKGVMNSQANPVHVFEDELYAVHEPLHNMPLIQKNGDNFTLYILTENYPHELKIRYQMLARNYDTSGELLISVVPKYENKIEIIKVSSSEMIREDMIEISDKMVPSYL